MTATVRYSFHDAGDQRPPSRDTRRAIRRRLREAGFRSVGTPREAIWEKRGDFGELSEGVGAVISTVERRGGHTLRELSITVR